MGPNPITYTEIKAWAALTGRKPNPQHVALLKRLDTLFLEVTAPKGK